MAQFGTAAQKETWLPEVARGEVLACFALTEPEAGSDPAGMKSAARREQDGWVLTGGKNFVTSGGEARFALVAAVTEPGQGAKGISAFVVDIPATPEITWGSREEKLGLRAAASVPLFFDEAHLPETSLLGERESGAHGDAEPPWTPPGWAPPPSPWGWAGAPWPRPWPMPKSGSSSARPWRIFRPSSGSWRTWPRIWKPPASSTLKAAWLKDQKRPYGLAAAMAKSFATDAAMAAATEGVQILGGYGCLADYPLERYFRDAKAGQIYEGTNEIMRLIIARNLLRG